MKNEASILPRVNIEDLCFRLSIAAIDGRHARQAV